MKLSNTLERSNVKWSTNDLDGSQEVDVVIRRFGTGVGRHSHLGAEGTCQPILSLPRPCFWLDGRRGAWFGRASRRRWRGNRPRPFFNTYGLSAGGCCARRQVGKEGPRRRPGSGVSLGTLEVALAAERRTLGESRHQVAASRVVPMFQSRPGRPPPPARATEAGARPATSIRAGLLRVREWSRCLPRHRGRHPKTRR